MRANGFGEELPRGVWKWNEVNEDVERVLFGKFFAEREELGVGISGHDDTS